MTMLPMSGASLLVRTDFADDPGWEQLRAEALGPNADGFEANVLPVNDRAFDGADWRTVKRAVPPNDEGAMVLFIVDAQTLSNPDHPILAIDLMAEADQNEPFRCVPAVLADVEANLNLANMDWDDFAGNADGSGVFRGF